MHLVITRYLNDNRNFINNKYKKKIKTINKEKKISIINNDKLFDKKVFPSDLIRKTLGGGKNVLFKKHKNIY